MAETLGSLTDKLAIVDLKLWHCQEILYDNPEGHSEDELDKLREKNESLLGQRRRLIAEIDEWFARAVTDPESLALTNPQNKMYGRFRKE
ncbi:MAG: hypothetical protein ACLFQX_07980 [Candidatus Kapaibacterium sp.]